MTEIVLPNEMVGIKGNPNKRVVFVAGGYYFALLVLDDGSVIRIGQKNSEPIHYENEKIASLNIPYRLF